MGLVGAKPQHRAIALYEIRVVIAHIRNVHDNFVIAPMRAVTVDNRRRYAVERQPDAVLVVNLDCLHHGCFFGFNLDFAPVGLSCVDFIVGDFLEFVAELCKLVPQRRVKYAFFHIAFLNFRFSFLLWVLVPPVKFYALKSRITSKWVFVR